jgi:tripartite-type tricarboxylate transporter receptor subunit TctC
MQSSVAAGRCLLFASLVLAGWHSLFAQDFPRKPIRIVTGSPGGGGDFASRLIAQGITGPLGQAVIVENHGNFTGEYVMRAAADGYTLLLDGTSFWVGPLLQDAPYDVEKDFAPITLAVNLPNVLVVAPTLPAKTVKELIDLAKRRPGEINYSAGSIGGPAHLAGELFKAMAGINMIAIPYKGGAPALSAVIGGEVQVNFATTTAAAPHIKSGRLRILAVTSAQPSVLVPGVPTIAAAGVPGYEAISTYGVFAPARTPAAIISVLNREMVKVLTTPEVKERLLSSGEEAVGSSPDELAAMVRADIVKWGNVIKNAGIRAN